ncbi:hypothetical protein GJ496_010453 [Pomphorhynchus laevis]|nr:hypothetical protein GJ496_010453 [Pomphorhynchus laevis]
MSWGFSETIFALASGKLPSAVAIVRASGVQVSSIIEKMVSGKFPAPRHLCYRKIVHSQSKRLLDHGMVVYFNAPMSYTGEDCCEFHLHGSKAIVSSVYSSLSTIPRVRLAHRGEFTQSEAEAVNDLIHSLNEVTQSLALKQMSGSMSRLVDKWRGHLMQIASILEANIEFAEEHDFTDSESYEFRMYKGSLSIIEQELASWLQRGSKVAIYKDGIKVCIVGPANAGKSTLMNSLTKSRRSITSSLAGTTRDVIETVLELDDCPNVLIADTAGLNSSSNDELELAGIERTYESVKNADVILYTIDICNYHDKLKLSLDSGKINVLLLNKRDLVDNSAIKKAQLYWENSTVFKHVLAISNFDEQDIVQLKSILSTECLKSFAPSDNDYVSVSTRHRSCVEQCLSNIRLAKSEQNSSISCEWIRQSIRALQLIDGQYNNFSEKVLDAVFSQFCVGK